MPDYGFVITRQGWDVLASLLAGEVLQISKVMVGAGRPPEGTDLAALTDLVEPLALATSTEPEVANSSASFIVEYRNDMNGGLNQGFWLNEFGLWALDKDGAEVMIYYATLGDYPQYIAPYSGGMLDSRRFPVTIALTDDVEITILYPPGAYVTAEYFAEKSAKKEDKKNKVALSEAATEDQYPNAKSTWNLIQEVAATVPAGGLMTPAEWPSESTLPDPAALPIGTYYFVQDMDISAPGHSGRAWVNYTDPSDNGSAPIWYKVHDQFMASVVFTMAQERSALVSGSSFETLFSQLAKWLDDLKSAAFKNAGAITGNVPVLGQSLGTLAGAPAVTDASGNLVPHSGGALGEAAFKGVNTVGGVPLITEGGSLPPVSGGMPAAYPDAGSQAARTLTIEGAADYSQLVNKVISIRSTRDLTGTSCTLNVNGLGAKSIYFFDGGRSFSATAPFTYALLNNQVYQVVYNGSYFYLITQNNGVRTVALSVAASAWSASSTYDGYAYQAAGSVSGVQSSGKGSYAQVFFNAATYPVAEAAGLFPVCVTASGSVTLYAKKVPTGTLTGACVIY
jgi:hypothetical protein